MKDLIKLFSPFRALAIVFVMVFGFFCLFPLIPDGISELIVTLGIALFTYLLYTILFRYAQYHRVVRFSYDLLTIDDQTYDWSEVRSYSVQYSSYLETLTIVLQNNRRFYLTGFVDGRKSRQFQKLKDRFLTIVAYLNSRNDKSRQIPEKGFFTTNWAKGLVVILAILGFVGLIGVISGKLKNPVPVLMILGLSGTMFFQVFKKTKAKKE